METFNLRGPHHVRPLPPSAEEQDLRLFRQLPDYDFLTSDGKTPTLVGQGGFGRVFKARLRGEFVAVKLLKPNPAMGSLFEREVTACRRLMENVDLPGLVKFLDFGMLNSYAGDVGYFTMRWVEGKPLFSCWSGLSIKQKDTVAFGLARTLDYLGRNHGIVHRDVKPTNILIDQRGFPTLVDFGIARVLVEGGGFLIEDIEPVNRNLTPLSPLTTTGSIIGTAGYAPQEQLSGTGTVTPQSDTFALGVTLMEMYQGHFIFGHREAQEVMRARQRSELGVDWRTLRTLNAVDPDGHLPEFLRRMTEPERHLRPTSYEVVRFTWERLAAWEK